MAAFSAIVVALGALWRLGERGAFVQHAFASAAHCLSWASAASLPDLFLY